jgi:hypothetical protein
MLFFIDETARFTPSFLGIDDSLMTNAHVYEVRPRKDRRGFDLISIAGQMQPATPSTTQSFSAGHATPSFAFTMKLAT